MENHHDKNTKEREEVEKVEEEENNKKEYVIQHLVISGGGEYGLAAYGALRELEKQGKWSVKNLKSCYGTSIGTCIIFMILLGYDWETLDKFLIERPWKKVFNIDWTKLLDIFDRCGIFSYEHFKHSWEPLFSGADLSVNITLEEFYQQTKVDFYIYASEINSFTLTCFSHKSHPKMKLLEACYGSCCLPLIFCPLILENKAYIDGGVFLNYPIYECLQQQGVHEKEVLGIRKMVKDSIPDEINNQSNLLEYMLFLMKKMVGSINHYDKYISIPNEIAIEMEQISLDTIMYIMECPENRRKIIQIGANCASQISNI